MKREYKDFDEHTKIQFDKIDTILLMENTNMNRKDIIKLLVEKYL